MSDTSVGSFFDDLAQDYTATVERCFPRYREMLWALLEYLPQKQTFENILELGCGTGNLSVLLGAAFPSSSITVVDVSKDSIDECRGRLGDHSTIAYEQQDFRKLDYQPESFDLIISSIAVHHLTFGEKKDLIQASYGWLKPGGLFTIADQFKGATDELYSCHIKNWKQQSLAAGSTLVEYDMWLAHQAEHDHHDTLVDHFDWLKNAGFQSIDCTWRYLLWSVIQATK